MYDKERQDQLRKLWLLHHAQCERIIARYRKDNNIPDDEEFSYIWVLDGLKLPPFPRVLNELTCGAKTRKGTPCKNKSLYASGRCKFHGGMSTGPKTKEGKKRSAENGKIAARRKVEQAEPMKG